MNRAAISIVAAIGLVAPALLAGSGVEAAASKACGLTTLNATLQLGDDGALECGPGEPLTVREDLAKAGKNRAKTRKPLLAVYSIADVQLADEESPLRGEWADKCEDIPTDGAFRPQETMIPQLLNAHIRAANAVAQKGSPVLKIPFSFAVGLGDLADNQQFNELRWIIDIFDGGQLVDPDSGDDGYVGVASQDPGGNPSDPLVSPIDGESLLDVANEPFWAPGLQSKGKRLPWYSVPGNHDIKVQGTIADDNPAWRAFARQWAVGPLKVMDIAPDKQQEACAGGFFSADFWIELLTSPGSTEVVPADPDRRLLDRADWIAEHSTTLGLPKGHGFLPEKRRCTDADGNVLERACYEFSHDPFHVISLDTNESRGLESGNIDDAQFEWLERKLIEHSSKYFDETGATQKNKNADDDYLIVLTHHTIDSTENTGFPPGQAQDVSTGEALRDLLLRFPNVIAQFDGHTHQNKIWAHENADLGTGYWEVNTSAISDVPHQSRTIEIADNGDGTLSIFAVIVDAATPPNPRSIDWTDDDPTNEVKLGGADRPSNELWLASAAREIGFYDPQTDLTHIGTPEDRNVELLIGKPNVSGSSTKKKNNNKGGDKSTGSGGGSDATSDGSQVLGSTSSSSGSNLSNTGVSIALYLLTGLSLIALGLLFSAALKEER